MPLFYGFHAKIAAVIAASQRHASLPDQLRMQPGIADVVAVAKAAAQLRAAVFCAGVVIGSLHLLTLRFLSSLAGEPGQPPESAGAHSTDKNQQSPQPKTFQDHL